MFNNRGMDKEDVVQKKKKEDVVHIGLAKKLV